MRQNDDEKVVPISRRKATPRQRAAGLKNLEKGIQARKKRAATRGPKTPDEKTRWDLLLAGELKVSDLSDAEIIRMRTTDRLGGFSGGPPHIPAPLAQKMREELIKRAQTNMENAIGLTTKVLMEIAAGRHGAKASDMIRASQLLQERVMGRVPEHINIHSADPWADILERVTAEMEGELDQTDVTTQREP